MRKREILNWAERRMKSAKAEPYECGYRYHHGLRVAAIAVWLGKGMDFSRSQLDVMYVAGVLHDIGKTGRGGNDLHGSRGAATIRRNLGQWLSPQEMEKVCAMVAHHYERPRSSWYKGKGKALPRWPKEILVIQDADILDHHGCMEVWGAILYARKDALSPVEMLGAYREEWKMERAEAMRSLNFEASRKELRRRFNAADTFWKELKE